MSSSLNLKSKKPNWQDCECCGRDFNAAHSWTCPYCNFDNNRSKPVSDLDRLDEDSPVVILQAPADTSLIEGRYIPKGKGKDYYQDLAELE